jgi:hypothetical protein
MTLGLGFGFDAGGFGLAVGGFLADPGFPGLAVGGVLAGEGDGFDVGVGDDLGRFAALGEELDAGRDGGGVAVEDVAFDLLAADGEGDVAAVVEGLVDGLAAVLLVVAGEDGVLEARSRNGPCSPGTWGCRSCCRSCPSR